MKREPVLIATAILAVINLLVGRDSGLDVAAVESIVVLAGGLLVRRKVSPAGRVSPQCVCADCPHPVA